MHFSFDGIQISNTLVLAIMALMGYVFGTLRLRRRAGSNEGFLRLQKDLSRARMAVGELEKVICTVRNSTAKHYGRLQKFQNTIAKLSNQQGDVIWHELCREIEDILNPTLQLVSEITNAQERIRYQSNYLMSFSEVRTDPLTGLGNRRALDSLLSSQFSMFQRYGTPFSLAIVDIDHFKDLNDQHGHLYGDEMLRNLTGLLTDTSRAVDVVARYGGDEFVVVMPQTDIEGASMMAERLREKIEKEVPFTISVGVASAGNGDTSESLFQRADTALYHAKSSGRNRTSCEYDETSHAVLPEAVAV